MGKTGIFNHYKLEKKESTNYSNEDEILLGMSIYSCGLGKNSLFLRIAKYAIIV